MVALTSQVNGSVTFPSVKEAQRVKQNPAETSTGTPSAGAFKQEIAREALFKAQMAQQTAVDPTNARPAAVTTQLTEATPDGSVATPGQTHGGFPGRVVIGYDAGTPVSVDVNPSGGVTLPLPPSGTPAVAAAYGQMEKVPSTSSPVLGISAPKGTVPSA